MYIADPRRIDRTAMIEAHECRVWERYREVSRHDDEKHERDDAWADAAMSAEARAMMAGLHFPKVKPHPDRGEWESEEEAAKRDAEEAAKSKPQRKLGKKKLRKSARVSA